VPATIDVDALLVAKLEKRYSGMPIAEIREDLARHYTPTWSEDELLNDFEVHQFQPGAIVEVIRKTDGKRGTVAFLNSPRLYFAFVADN
jgi:hypothetical protein